MTGWHTLAWPAPSSASSAASACSLPPGAAARPAPAAFLAEAHDKRQVASNRCAAAAPCPAGGPVVPVALHPDAQCGWRCRPGARAGRARGTLPDSHLSEDTHMISEIAQFSIKPGMEAQFEQGVAQAKPIFLRARLPRPESAQVDRRTVPLHAGRVPGHRGRPHGPFPRVGRLPRVAPHGRRLLRRGARSGTRARCSDQRARSTARETRPRVPPAGVGGAPAYR